MRKIAFLFLSLSSLFLWASAHESGKHSQDPTPAWVKPYSIPIEMPLPKPSQVNLQYLLIDTQRNVAEKTYYHHFIIKALTQSGIESLSQIQVDFDPSYAQVSMHEIRLLRDGKWYDRLQNARHNLIQRETNLEQNLYNGDLTVVYFLDDIREGDVIEYAYSFVGDSPLASSHYTDWVCMQRSSAAEKITYRLLAHPDLTFSTKSINTEILPQMQDLTPSLREWIWEAIETPAYTEESDQPVWYNQPAHIQMSEYGSWGEVVQNILPLYHLPDDYCSSEMCTLVEQWQQSSAEVSKQALLALRFVQDQIRYLGFEDGMGAFQPTAPAITLKRRFGDCKDKTFLLHALLQSMGIPSKMVLVHTNRGPILPDELPSPFAFNHVVLQLQIENTTYFVDPTWSLQGGLLEKTFFPEYTWGLILAKNSKALVSLPSPTLEHPTKIDSRFTVVAEDAVDVRMKSTFYGGNADRIRRSLKWVGPEEIAQYCLSRMQNLYGAASFKESIETSDDRENNIVTLIESYNIPTQVFQDQKKLDLLSYTLRNYLCTSINPERSSPYEISHPLWVKEQILVETPFIEWTPFKADSSKAHEAFVYSSSMDIKKHQACFNLELKHLKDHIPKHALHDSWKILREISRRGLPSMTVATSPTSFFDINLPLLFSILALIIWIPLYLFSRRKRPTQDELSYCLKKAQAFYIISNALNLSAIDPKIAPFVLVGTIILLLPTLHLILMKRTCRPIIAFQAWISFQTGFITFLLFAAFPYIHIGHKAIVITVYFLYSATILAALHRAKKYLIEESKVGKAAT